MKQVFILVLSLFTNLLAAQSIHKDIVAVKLNTSPVVDGVLEPELWTSIPKATDWTQMEPRNGEHERASQKSEVQFIYTDKALYIGAMFYDHAPDSILKELSMRDERDKNCDWFGVWISPYNDSQNDFMFTVTAAGIQLDARSSADNFDMNWDAVWKSAVKINDKGWTVEMEIPYSALRIPNTNFQEWGINLGRTIRRTRENYSWNPIDISNSNYAAQAGVLKGIENIKPPKRLSFMPYLSSYIDFYENKSIKNTNGGLDLKYGINESFTLDMTLVPDFGQTVFDDQILNVSPFEVQFNENRNFFTEGTELFNKSNLFYSRRIGENPSLTPKLQDTEQIVESPSKVQLLNASKISGRTSKGLGIGIFNAITEETFANIEDTLNGDTRKELIEPLTNYSVLVLDQVLKNNSFITFTNTNVLREGNTRDANVEKLQVQIGTEDNRYTFYGDVSLSHIFDNQTRSDGFGSFLLFEKSSGNFRFKVAQNIESDSYQINDLGFLSNNNEFKHFGELSYYIFQPKGKLRKADFELGLSRKMLYSQYLYNNTKLSADIRIHLMNFFSSGISIKQDLGETHNYFEARTADLDNVFITKPSTSIFWWNSTDYRKRFAGDLGLGYSALPQFGSRSYHIRFSPRLRVSDHIFMSYVISYKTEKNNVGRAFDMYYSNLTDEDDKLLFSKRDRNTVTNVFKASYVANNKLSFNIKLRHYWSTLQHNSFYELTNGNLHHNNFSFTTENDVALYDINFNTWNIDFNCVWRFAPGSELNFQWKNSLSNLHKDASLTPLENLNDLFEESNGNSLSLKLVYYLDYQNLKK